MQSSIKNPGFFQSEGLTPLVVVTHFAGLDQALAAGFEQVSIHLTICRHVTLACTLHLPSAIKTFRSVLV